MSRTTAGRMIRAGKAQGARHAGRHVGRHAGHAWAARAALAAGWCMSLAACSSVPDSVNPVAWVHHLEGGAIEQPRPPPPGATQPYPNLASVPDKPVATDPKLRAQIASALIADRTNAQYVASQQPIPDPSNPQASPHLFGAGTARPPTPPGAPGAAPGAAPAVPGAAGAPGSAQSATPAATASLVAAEAPPAKPEPAGPPASGSRPARAAAEAAAPAGPAATPAAPAGPAAGAATGAANGAADST